MYWWNNFTFIFSDGNVKYFFFYIVVSFIGKFVSELAYCLHLLDVIVINPYARSSGPFPHAAECHQGHHH